MQKSNIDWCEFTSNPVKGECPVDCSYCYVKPIRRRYGWHKDIRFYPEELDAIRRRKKPARIFVGSTIELFHDKTIQYMPEIIETIRACPQHTIMLLTKQPKNLQNWNPFPPNCQVGVTVTNDAMFRIASIELMKVEAQIKYISFEPLLDWNTHHTVLTTDLNAAGINWVIIGALTGTYKELITIAHKHPELTLTKGKKWALQPKIEWVREIIQACDKAKLPIFMKDNLRPMWYNYLRQEMPVEDNYANHRRDPTRL